MIDKNHKIMDMLANILDKVNAIYFNMQEDGKTHYSYMLEKLESAKHDLDILVEFTKKYKEDK